jgi:hypothetical protein
LIREIQSFVSGQSLTGLILTVITRKSHHAAEEFVFRLFRRQHLAMFLPGLKKLGLDKEPAAVAASKYHYFSNQLGGVKVEYYEESPRKAWIRYPPPRWIWKGTAICAVPSKVNRAMLRGWHAHNGVTMGNLRLGFVCTKTTVDGQPGLEGYYFEYDHDLAEVAGPKKGGKRPIVIMQWNTFDPHCPNWWHFLDRLKLVT